MRDMRALVAIALTCLCLLPAAPAAADGPSRTPDVHLFTVTSSDNPGTFGWTGGLAAGPDGSIYAMDLEQFRILRFGADGRILTTWGSGGRRQGQFAFGTGSANYTTATGIAVAPDGTVYVADPGNDRIQRFTGDGRFLTAWGRRGSDPGTFHTPIDIAIAPTGEVYVQDAGNLRVQRFDGRGTYRGEFGGPGSGEGELDSPVDVAVDWYGRVYVSDTGSFRIAQYSADGDFYDTLGFFGGGDGQFQAPAGIGVDPRRPADAGEAWVYAVDAMGNLLQRFTGSDRPLMAWGGGGFDRGLLSEPVDVAVAPDGRVYVAEAGSGRVQVFDASGKHLAIWGSRALSSYRQRSEVQPGEGSFEGVDVAVAPDGSFYVADRDERVLHFSSAGRYLGTWGYAGYGGVDGEFGDIRALAVAPDGTVYVLDRDRRVQVFTSQGDYLRAWDVVLSRLPSSNARPSDLASGPDGTLYVTSRDLPRLLRFGPTGALLGEWRPWSGWGPELVAVGPSSDVYTAGHGRFAVDRFNAAGDRLGKWGSKGTGPGQFGGDCDDRYGHCRAGDLAVDRDGLVYVGDAGMGRVQRFTREGRYVDSVVPDVPPPSSLFPAFRFDVDASGPSPRLLVFDTYYGRALHVYGGEPPDNWRAEYYGNPWLAERPLLIEYRSRLDLVWDDSAPVLDMPSDGLSARFRRFVTVPPGLYRFTLTTQGGARFWVDDRLVADVWSGRNVAATVAVPLGAAQQDLLVEYRTTAKSGAVRLTWSRTGDLSAVYLPAARRD